MYCGLCAGRICLSCGAARVWPYLQWGDAICNRAEITLPDLFPRAEEVLPVNRPLTLTPNEALARRESLIDERKTELHLKRRYLRGLRKRHIDQGRRPLRPKRSDGTWKLIIANTSGAGPLLEELKFGELFVDG